MVFRKNRKTPALAAQEDPVIIWDVGGVILEWDSTQLAKKYDNGKYEKECLAIFKHDNWVKFDRGDLHYQDLLKIYNSQLNLPAIKINAMLTAGFHSLKPKWPVIHLVQQLKEAGYQQYCLTNGSREYLNYVTGKEFQLAYSFSLYELFNEDQIVLSSSINRVKPEPEIYQYTLTQFKLQNRRIIFIDDSEKNVAGALAAGWWRAIHFENLAECVPLLESYLSEM
jgi:2-haloacid dehalogenase